MPNPYILAAKMLIAAKRSMEPQKFQQFCADTGLEYGGPTYRKILSIGEIYLRFEHLAGGLPTSFESLYHLARISKLRRGTRRGKA